MADSSSSSSSASLSSSNSIGSTSRNAPMTNQQQLEHLCNLFRVHLGQSNVNRPSSQVIQPFQNLNDFPSGDTYLNEPSSQVIQPLGSLNDLSRVQFGEPNAPQVTIQNAANEYFSNQMLMAGLQSSNQQVTRSVEYHPRSAPYPTEVVVTEVVRTTRFLIPPQTMQHPMVPFPFDLNVAFLDSSSSSTTTTTTTIHSFFPDRNTPTTPTVEPSSFPPNPNTSRVAPHSSTLDVNVSAPPMEPRLSTPNPNLPPSATPISAIPIRSIPPPSETQGDGMTHSLPHSKYGPYTCPVCNSEFPTSQKFAAHMGSHYKHESKEETLRRQVAKYRKRPYYRNRVRVFLSADGSESSSSVAGNNRGEEIVSETAENVEPTTNTPTEVVDKEEPTTVTPDEDNHKEEPKSM